MSLTPPVSPTPGDLALKAELEHRASLYHRHRDKLIELCGKAVDAGWTEDQIRTVTGMWPH